MNSGATAPEWVAGGFNCVAWVNFHGVPTNGTYVRSGNTVTVTMTAHGMATGMIAGLDFTSGAATDGSYAVTVVDANTFTITDPASGATSGNVTRNTYIRASGNVSSITDNGTGHYTISFTSALPDANYATIGSARVVTGVATTILTIDDVITPTTTACSVRTFNPSGSALVDSAIISVSIFR